jgi:hypothetical protein
MNRKKDRKMNRKKERKMNRKKERKKSQVICVGIRRVL